MIFTSRRTRGRREGHKNAVQNETNKTRYFRVREHEQSNEHVTYFLVKITKTARQEVADSRSVYGPESPSGPADIGESVMQMVYFISRPHILSFDEPCAIGGGLDPLWPFFFFFFSSCSGFFFFICVFLSHSILILR